MPIFKWILGVCLVFCLMACHVVCLEVRFALCRSLSQVFTVVIIIIFPLYITYFTCDILRHLKIIKEKRRRIEDYIGLIFGLY